MVNAKRYKQLALVKLKTQTLTNKITNTKNFFENLKKEIINPLTYYSEISELQYKFYKSGIIDFEKSYLLATIDFFKNQEQYDKELVEKLKLEIFAVLDDYVDEIEPYLLDTKITYQYFSNRFNGFIPYRNGDNQISSISTLYEIFGTYNKQILIDFFNQCEKFPDQTMIKDYCDHRIEFIEQIRLLIELVL